MKATAILAGPSETLARATSGNSSFKAFVPSQEVDVWTDDYASLVAALRAHRKGDAKITDLP